MVQEPRRLRSIFWSLNNQSPVYGTEEIMDEKLRQEKLAKLFEIEISKDP